MKGPLTTDFVTQTLLGYGIGPGVGDIQYLVQAKTSTNYYYQWLLQNGATDDSIYTALASAYSNTSANRGDIIFVTPGDYTVTASLTWANSQTHLIGLGGPNQRHAPAAGTTGMVRFYCTTAAVNNILNVTGDYCNMAGFQLRNTYSANTNVCDLKLSGRNFYASNIALRGGGGANQVNAHAGIPLYIDTSGGSGAANYAIFDGCWIGDPFGTARTVGEAIYVDGTTGQGACIELRGCRVMTTSETAAVSAINLAGNYAIDRYLLLENTLFYNFSVNLAHILTQVVTDSQGTTHTILTTGSTAQYGWGKWSSNAAYLFSALPVGASAGGTAVTVTG